MARTVVVGGSAGSIEVMLELAKGLPAGLPAPVLVTVHIGVRSRLPAILSRTGSLPASHARHGEPLEPGHIYVAPPDRHLLATAGAARLSRGPRVNRQRPAVDERADEHDREDSGMPGMAMSDSTNPGFLGPDEARLTRLSCPDCGGGLAEIDVPGLRSYRCHVGHQYNPLSLEAAQREAAEAKLWTAVAALEEHAALVGGAR